MKTIFKPMLLGAFFFVGATTAYANPISVDGEIFEVPSILIEERTLVGVHSLIESLGGYTQWDEEERRVTVTHENAVIELVIDSEIGIVDGEEVELEVPAIIYNESTFLPLRFIAESLGFSVNFRDGMAVILTPNFIPPTLAYLEEMELLEGREVITLFHNENLVGNRIQEGYYTVIAPIRNFGFFSVLNENGNLIFTDGVLGYETPEFLQNLLQGLSTETTVYLLENHVVYLENFEYLIFIR